MSLGPMVWVVEGTDGVGKSTFAQGIVDQVRRTGAKGIIVHNGPPGDIKYLYRLYKNQIEVAIKRRDQHGDTTVIDRSFLSEYVYGAHRPAGSQLTKRQVRRLERFCKKNDVVLLGIEASIPTRKARLKARGETWSHVNAFTGAVMGYHFRTRSAFWTIAASPAATASTESN